MGLFQNIAQAFSPGGAQGYRSREADIDYEKQLTASRKQLADQQAEDFHVRSLHDLMDQGALPVGPGGVVKRTMHNAGNPSMGTMASGDIPGMPALPAGVGPTNGTLIDKADPSRVITHKSPDGQVFQFELPTAEAQRNRAQNPSS